MKKNLLFCTTTTVRTQSQRLKRNIYTMDTISQPLPAMAVSTTVSSSVGAAVGPNRHILLDHRLGVCLDHGLGHSLDHWGCVDHRGRVDHRLGDHWSCVDHLLDWVHDLWRRKVICRMVFHVWMKDMFSRR